MGLKYDVVWDFCDGFAAVRLDGKSGFINKNNGWCGGEK